MLEAAEVYDGVTKDIEIDVEVDWLVVEDVVELWEN